MMHSTRNLNSYSPPRKMNSREGGKELKAKKFNLCKKWAIKHQMLENVIIAWKRYIFST